ncbi:hypothetical protein [Streptomyces sp. NPDC059455]|uniref:hypothetical protein n=1 Tax=Streptomyces sp. NPDC059455 TaxID=3346837 RepID=UPI0036B9D2F7
MTPAAAYPHGATVDFVATRGPHHLQLRVHERGVGETRACGTGACAAVAAARAHQPSPPLAVDYTADLPGGRLHIVVRPSGAIDLTGPALITAQGTVSLIQPSGPGFPVGSRTGHIVGLEYPGPARSGGAVPNMPKAEADPQWSALVEPEEATQSSRESSPYVTTLLSWAFSVDGEVVGAAWCGTR